MNEIVTWESLGIDLLGKEWGNVKTYCPKCQHERKNHPDDKPLSVNVDDKVWLCHHCEWKGSLSKAAYQYTRLADRDFKCSQKVLDYFAKRAISQSTLDVYKIGSELDFNGNGEWILFPFYERGQLINIKSRNAKKDFRLVSNAKLIFYGMDICNSVSSDEVYIVEGEIDTLSFYEVGIKNVVSVPNGASKGNKMEFLDHCFDFLKSKNKIVIAVDNDDAGIELGKAIVSRIGSEKCFTIDYEDCKDANEVLLKHGGMRLKQIAGLKREIPLVGVLTEKEVDDELENLYTNGYPVSLTLNVPELDTLIRWRKGELTTVTGTPGSGKSNWLDWVAVMLAAQHGWKFGIFSAENPNDIHLSKLAQHFTGRPFFHHADKMERDLLEVSKEFIKSHFKIIRINQVGLKPDDIIDKAREICMRFGIDAFVLDPWNYLSQNIKSGYSETLNISEILTRLVQFKDTHNLHVFLVAHPKKMETLDNGKMKVPSMYDVSGSAHFFNKTDNGIVVYRNFKPDNADDVEDYFGTAAPVNSGDPKDDVTIFVKKIRFSFVGKLGQCKLSYEPIIGRYKSASQNDFALPLNYYLESHTNSIYSQEPAENYPF